ncbi:MAG: hypothetical protein ACJ8AI_20645 [Rhodopila sp.]
MRPAHVLSHVSPDAAVRRIWPYLPAVLAGLIIAVVSWFSIGFLVWSGCRSMHVRRD